MVCRRAVTGRAAVMGRAAGMTPTVMPTAGVVSASVSATMSASPMTSFGSKGNTGRHGQDCHDQCEIPDRPRQL